MEEERNGIGWLKKEGERERKRGERVLVALTVATSSGPASEERSLTL